MLALDDGALARLCIGATRVRRHRRSRWLKDIAAELETPTISRAKSVADVTNGSPAAEQPRSPAAVRQAKLRANRKAARHCYKLWISDSAVHALIVRCILSGQLTEEQALRPNRVAQALAALLEEMGQRWAR